MIVLQSRAFALDKGGGSTLQNREPELSLGWASMGRVPTREPFFNSSHTHVLIVVSVPLALSIFAPWREILSALAGWEIGVQASASPARLDTNRGRKSALSRRNYAKA